CTRLPTRDYW
nr:immunoglobulin heavy chain junction region [Mus musculus]